MSPSLKALGARALQIRPLVRSPIWLFQHGLGWLLGPRFLLLEHIGRTSGEPRYVCLEVSDRPDSETFVVMSGFGERAQWYRNLRADPRCHVSSGRLRRAPATARILSVEEAGDALDRYARAHPKAWERLQGVISEAQGHQVEQVPVVELRLTRA
ncbi:MAG: nitroreductase family deazaflavin-dependent oxidoreductase [Actinomycetales bacterium]